MMMTIIMGRDLADIREGSAVVRGPEVGDTETVGIKLMTGFAKMASASGAKGKIKNQLKFNPTLIVLPKFEN